ncbi:GNAT family N-acetyltransferase [Marilutibacter chinensis]|uniref:GNAT family N-acetyltransferase n=1 Tax=Marilutibacter chinensis TaxID=2912247 RepID=A0ABS9HMU4_9GAMM|nr:GNAT family N-acetyltransferase [Lysobacter chinensis]MCF7220334.1 GNAT family N-acetyltransferase [Lysobacter chinensis]
MSATEIRWLAGLDQVEPSRWDALHDGRNPFVSHAFLAGLEQYGCIRPDWGWTPHHLTLWRDGALIAAAPGYLKNNSHGEFVFDHAWAHAYTHHGLEYFPKWLCAVPYSPVSGPRLLAADAAHRSMLTAAMATFCDGGAVSSAHVNFHPVEETPCFGADWLQRLDVQYHWRNDAGWQDFDAFLAAFDHKHRKNIRQERSRVARSRVGFRIVHGDEADPADLAAMHGFYLQTFAEYGNHPALTLPFLRHLAATMPRQLVLILAELGGDTVAGALCLRGGDTLYGRYWGSHVRLPGLHFETCYYQGIDYCLREGLTRFEPGAQGEHKLARGFLPALTRSHHWIAHPQFRAALQDWCRQQTAAVRQHARTLAAHSPFRRAET